MRNSITRFLLSLGAALCVVGAADLAHADADKVAWVGGDYGLSVPNESNTTSRGVFGINGGAKIGSEFGVGAYYLSSHKDESVNGVTQPWNYDLYGVMAGYFFEGEANGVYLGVMLGTSKVGSSVGGISYQTSPFHYGFVAGYDYLIGEHFSLGGNLNYISVASSSATVALPSGSITQSTDPFGMLNFLVSAKIWF